MKKYLVILLLCLGAINSFSQLLFSEDIYFETNSNLVEIDTSQSSNIWQIGTPSKAFFDSAFSIPLAIVTDTVNSYPTNSLSSFQVKIKYSGSMWGTGFLNFRHKYDFDTSKDGGYIEIKYDSDTVWTNIIFDTDSCMMFGGLNFYSSSDTIIGNIPSFTGNSGGWINSAFRWIWSMSIKSFHHDSLTIRFTMKSDSVETNQEGWLIDNISLTLFGPGSGINDLDQKYSYSKIFPNPVSDFSYLIFENDNNTNVSINIFDFYGRKFKSIKTKSDKVIIDKTNFNSGIYFYQIVKDKAVYDSGKFVVIE